MHARMLSVAVFLTELSTVARGSYCHVRADVATLRSNSEDPLQLTRTSDLPAGGQSLIDLKSTYCFGAHMHEIMEYFMFTENQ